MKLVMTFLFTCMLVPFLATAQYTGGQGRGDVMEAYSAPPTIQITFAAASICNTIPFQVFYSSPLGVFQLGNTFTVQMSDANGSFDAPLNIGSITETYNSGSIMSAIPEGVADGSGYRIRVVSSSPEAFSTDNGQDITISTAAPFDPAFTYPNDGILCTNAGIVFPDLVATPGGVWSSVQIGLALDPVTGAIDAGASTPGGSFTVVHSGGFGSCGASTSALITILQAPTATINYGSLFCEVETVPVNPYVVGASGGTFASDPIGLNLDPVTGGFIPSLSVPGQYTVIYTIPATVFCPSSTTTTTFILIPDSDGDGICDPADNCPNTPGQIGSTCDDGDACTIVDMVDAQCNCVGTFQDSDNDGVCDLLDMCPSDPLKTAPGACGCGVPDTDTDGDGAADCIDGCPIDPDKTAPGECGCGVPDVATTWYADTDGDGFGDPNAPLAGSTCLQPPGYVANNTDCNDGNAAVNPGSTEIACNGLDDDCNGVVDGGSTANLTPSEGDYRTVGSGDWSTTEIWERYDGSAYVAAPAPPGSGDGVIVVRDGHTVNITDVREADQVVVESCGSLQLQSGQLTVANGPDEDVLVLGSLQLSGGSLFGPGDITVSASGSFAWTGGSVRTTAVLHLEQGSNSMFGFGGFGFLGNSGTINNAGTFTMTSGRLIIGEAGPGAFNNLSTGVLNFNGANNSENSWEQNTTNHGVINKNIAASFGMHGTFVNNGTVNVATDELYIAANTTNNGTMAFAGAGTTLRTNGTFTNTGTGVITDPATLRVSGGTFTSESGASITGVDFLDLAGTTTLASGSTCTAPTAISVQGEFQYAMPFTPNTLNLFGNGQLRGPGAITIPSGGSFTWTGGNVQVNAVLHLEQGSNSVLNFGGFGFVGNNGTINNAGTFTRVNGEVIIGEPGPGAFNNLPTGVLTFQGGGFWTQNLTNEGIIACDLAGTFDLNGTFVNNGAVNVATGELGIGATTTNNGTMTFAGAGTTLRTGGEFTNTATGVITNPATLRVGGGTFTSQSGASISGVDFLDIIGVIDLQGGSTCTSPNTITVSSGQLNHAMPFTVNTLNLIGSGQLRGPGAITVPSGGGFTWTGGAVMANAILNLEQGSNSVFSFGGFPFLVNNGTINNAGTFTRSVGQLIIQDAGPGAFNNLPTGVLTFNGGGFWSQNITNEGVIDNNLSGNFDINENFNNLPGGLVNVNSGTLTIGGPQTMAGKFMVAAGATLNSGQPFSFTGTEVENNGSITVQNLRFQGIDAQQLTGTGSIADMTLNGSGGVDLGATQAITGSLTLTNGTLRLGANDLVLSNAAAGAIAGGSAASHVVTNGTGSLRRPVSGAGYVFPVGTAGSYTPAMLDLTSGPSEDFRVRVLPGVSAEYATPGVPSGGVLTSDLVGRTWVVEEQNPGGNEATLTLHWNEGDELPGFGRTNCALAAYTGSDWTTNPFGAASGSGPFSRSHAGITQFREFTVAGEDNALNTIPLDCAGVPGGPAFPGGPCDDGIACTVNDVYDSACNCAGIQSDTDGDGICDALDTCPTVPGELGGPCDDGDPLTANDVLNANCQCVGAAVDCEGTPNGTALPGTPCDDGDACTINDQYNNACACVGTVQDSDGDGICDAQDSCPNEPGQVGSPCDDGNVLTGNDTLDATCNCVGISVDCAGVPNGTILPGTPCDDGNACTTNDVLDNACNCAGTPLPDSDGDGICDVEDGCPFASATIDFQDSATCSCQSGYIPEYTFNGTNNILARCRPCPTPTGSEGEAQFICAGGSAPVSVNVDPVGLLQVQGTEPMEMVVGVAAEFGAPIATTPLAGELVYVPDAASSTLGCSAFAPGALAGKVALIDRGTCNFTSKALNAQNAGAIGVVIANNQPGGNEIGMAGSEPDVIIPVVSVSLENGQYLKQRLLTTAPVLVNTVVHPWNVTWSPPDGLNSTVGAMVMAAPLTTTSYTATISNVFGCQFGPLVPVTVNVLAIGASCDDGDPSTMNDTMGSDCVCAGTPVDCAGVPGGTAYLDDCGTCVGGNTGLNPCDVGCVAQVLTKFGLGFPIPDFSTQYTVSSFVVVETGPLASITVSLNGLSHPWAGDLEVVLSHVESGLSMPLFMRIGQTGTGGLGYASNFNGTYRFGDVFTGSLWQAASVLAASQDIPAGDYFATGSLSPNKVDLLATFGGMDINGTWQLSIRDLASGDIGSFSGWTLTLGTACVNDCAGVPGGSALPGTPCDDGNASTVNDLYDNSCQCVGTPASVQVQARMVLEGPYDPATGLMGDALRTLPSFPLSEPYTDLGYGFVGGGGETVSPAQLAVIGPDAIVDWVVVEVRDAVTGIPVMASRSALLQRDGDVVDVDGTPSLGFNLPPGLYQVAVLHRNHLGTMTKVPVALGALTAVDFTPTTMETFGIQGQKHVSGTFPVQALWAGDVTFDGVIKYTGENNDRDPILTAIGGIIPTSTITGYHGTDVNMDGTVKYTGEDNDRDPILQNIGGVVPTNVRVEQVP